MPELMTAEMSHRLAAIINVLPLERAQQVRNDLEDLRNKKVLIASMDDLPADMRDALLEVEAQHARP